MRILIAGGLGFVGGRLAVHLLQAGHQIVLGSRCATNPPNWLPQAELVQIDWADARALERICVGVDLVIQAAGMNAQECFADPVAALDFNGVATARLLAAATRAAVRRFVYLSTAHVYGSPLVGTITEDTCPRNLHSYATSHLAGEFAVLSACQRGLIQGIVLRLSNAFGAPTHRGVNCWMLLVNDLCKQTAQTRAMALQTNGLQHRDFVGMGEVCRVVEVLATCKAELLPPGVFNVGAGTSKSVLEMAQLIQQRCKQVLGFDPVLHRAEGGSSERVENLFYRAVALEKMGVIVSQDCTAEIDRLLTFCQSSFDRVSSSSR